MSRADVPNRRVRPTIRCLTDDLGLWLPGLETDLGSVEHPMVAETRRIAPATPRGQKRILSIADTLVYRVRHGDLRGATWLEQATGVVWLCAVERREEGSDDDAFVYFGALHSAGRLLPSAPDRLRDRAEAAIRLLDGLTVALLAAVEAAVATPGAEHQLCLADYLPARVLVIQQPGLTEIWCALSTIDAAGGGVSTRLRDALFAKLEAAFEPAEWEARADWPSGAINWSEVVVLGLKET